MMQSPKKAVVISYWILCSLLLSEANKKAYFLGMWDYAWFQGEWWGLSCVLPSLMYGHGMVIDEELITFCDWLVHPNTWEAEAWKLRVRELCGPCSVAMSQMVLFPVLSFSRKLFFCILCSDVFVNTSFWNKYVVTSYDWAHGTFPRLANQYF